MKTDVIAYDLWLKYQRDDKETIATILFLVTSDVLVSDNNDD